MADKNYESTVMRMAGNIAAGLTSLVRLTSMKEAAADIEQIPTISVHIARAIVAEVKRTEPKEGNGN